MRGTRMTTRLCRGTPAGRRAFSRRRLTRWERVRWAHGAAVHLLAVGRHPDAGSTSTPTCCSSQLTDELLYHGDVNAALRRMLQDGMRGPDGEQLQGLRDLLAKLREERQQRLDQPRPRWRVRRDQRASSTTSSTRSGTRSTTPCATPRRVATSAARQNAREAAAERNMRLDLMPERPRRQGPRADAYNFESTRRSAALRADDGPAARAADAADGRPDVARACRT